MKDIVAILLCAGKGTRMNDDSTNKVCFSVNGIPAVQRTVNNMKKAGIERFVIVVGHKAEKVMECLSCYDGIAYAYQNEQNGTGNAALMGLNLLDSLGYEGAALICMGDKIISSDVISKLIDKYRCSSAKTVFAVQPKDFNPSGGRIAMTEDKVCGIYEMTDSYVLRLGALPEQNERSFIQAMADVDINEKKKAKILSYANANIGSLTSSVELANEHFTHEDIEAMPYVNTATYLCDVGLTINAINQLGCNNAQGEIYLTDAINIMACENGTEVIAISSKEDMLTFATQEELKEVSNYFAMTEKE